MNRVVVIKSDEIDHRLPEGEFLVHVLPSGEVHLAFRKERWETWPLGAWKETQSDG